MIEQSLNQYVNQLSALLDVLLQEKKMLSARNDEQLLLILEKKKIFLQAIKATTKDLQQIPKQKIKEFFEQDGQLEEHITALFHQCQQQNIQNGSYVMRSMHTLQQFLATINPKANSALSQYNIQGKLF